MLSIKIEDNQAVYFASDFHLGAPNHAKSLIREKRIVRWLDSIEHNAHSIFLVGDLFDFWYEYSSVVPKGHVRLLGKLANLADSGIKIYVFTGNHDMWMFGYFEEELGIPVFRKCQHVEINGTSFHIGHGDGLGPGDHVYKLFKMIFENKVCRWLFSRVHPNFAIGLARFWSRRSRETGIEKEVEFFGEKEWLVQYSRSVEENQHHDYYIFGHRHFPKIYPLNDKSNYVNLGEWMNYYTYACFDGNKLEIKEFEN